MMKDLKSKLMSDKQIEEHRIRTPANCETVSFQFHGHKMVKIVGKLAEQELGSGQKLQGLLVRKDFDLHMVAPEDLPAYSTMKTTKVSHRQILAYSGSFARLQMELSRAYEPGEDESALVPSEEKIEVMGQVSVRMSGDGRLSLEWEASPVCDAIVDHIIAIVADIEAKPGPPPSLETESESEIEALQRAVKLDLLREQFGDVTLDEETKIYTITFDDGGTAVVNDEEQSVTCEDERNRSKLRYALRRIENALFPMPDYFEDDYDMDQTSADDDEAEDAAGEPGATPRRILLSSHSAPSSLPVAAGYSLSMFLGETSICFRAHTCHSLFVRQVAQQARQEKPKQRRQIGSKNWRMVNLLGMIASR